MGEYSGVFLVIKHVSVGGFWDWSNSYKGLFFVKIMVKNGGYVKMGFGSRLGIWKNAPHDPISDYSKIQVAELIS